MTPEPVNPDPDFDPASRTSYVPWLGVALYYLLAIGISTPFRFARWAWYRHLELPWHLTGLKSILEGAGPLVGAIVAWQFFPAHRRTVTLSGTSGRRSWIAAALPVVIFTVLGSSDDPDLNRHLDGLILGVTVYLYCLCEEIGWRGYLHDAFGALSTSARTLLIGTLWFAWHLSFLNDPFNPHQLYFLAALVFGAWGLGKVVEQTGSLALSSLFHLAINVIFFNQGVTGVAINQRLIGMSIVITVGIFLTARWPRREKYISK